MDAQDAVTGPGTHLHRMLSSMGIKPTAHCKCLKLMRQMDWWGPDGCEHKMPNIVKRIQREAIKRQWPLVNNPLAAWSIEGLVRRAIKKARQSNG